MLLHSQNWTRERELKEKTKTLLSVDRRTTLRLRTTAAAALASFFLPPPQSLPLCKLSLRFRLGRGRLFSPWTPSHKTIAHQSPARLFAPEDDDALFTWFHSSFGPVPQMSDQMERVRLLLRALFTPLSLSCFPGRERVHSRDPLLPKTLPQSTRERGHLFEFSK